MVEDQITIQCYIRTSEYIGYIKNIASSILKSNFADYNPEVKQLLDNLLDGELFFMDKMGMMNTKNLINGNLVLLGDAGYCPTAVSEMGASLSIYEAKELAQYIAEYPDDILTGCDSYNTLMQPIVGKFQTNAKNNAASFLPKSEADLEKFVNGFRAADDKTVQKIMTEPIVLTKDLENFILN